MRFAHLHITTRFGSQALRKVLVPLGLLQADVSSLADHETGTAVFEFSDGWRSFQDYGGRSTNVWLNPCLAAIWIGLGAAFHRCMGLKATFLISYNDITKGFDAIFDLLRDKGVGDFLTHLQ